MSRIHKILPALTRPVDLDQGRTACTPGRSPLPIVSMRFGRLFCDNADCTSREGLIAHISARADLQCNSLVYQGLPCCTAVGCHRLPIKFYRLTQLLLGFRV